MRESANRPVASSFNKSVFPRPPETIGRGRELVVPLRLTRAFPSSRLSPPHAVASPRRGHRESGALELEEAREDGRRRKIERANEVLGREAVLPAERVEDAPGLRRHLGRRGG